ncbi:MAG: hypothetical protein HGA36_00655 [Candidatus Moranbacteria bacterium]|nr:hypothetical protein [Candidatus Moranbacteria bacterium]
MKSTKVSAQGGSALSGKEKIKKITYWAGVSAIGIVVGFSLQFTKAWTEPTAPAPGGNVGAPITTGLLDQVKNGGLAVSNGIVTSFLGVNGNVTFSGVGNGMVFPDGTKQTTAAAAQAGDNLGNHTATAPLNMNGKSINGVDVVSATTLNATQMTINYNGKILASQLVNINGSEDVYSTSVEMSWALGNTTSDTCNGDFTTNYGCALSDNKTCIDTSTTYVLVKGEPSPRYWRRNITCKVATALNFVQQ